MPSMGKYATGALEWLDSAAMGHAKALGAGYPCLLAVPPVSLLLDVVRLLLLVGLHLILLTSRRQNQICHYSLVWGIPYFNTPTSCSHGCLPPRASPH
jgi:hypothetical protein